MVKYPISIATTFLWIGFISAISFMEAWLKFQAPGVSLPVGLGIGRIVFNALNNVEWVLVIALIVDIFVLKNGKLFLYQLFYAIPVFILILQTVWLLPVLDQQAEMIIQGGEPVSSNVHIYYVIGEVVKVVSLTVYGIILFKKQNCKI